MQLLTSLGHPNKPHFLIFSSLPYLKNKSSSEVRRKECHWEDAVAKLDNSILESSDTDVHPSKEQIKVVKLNLQKLFVQMFQKQNTSWKKTNLKCEDCEYTTKGELYFVKHSAKLQNQFVECGLDYLTVQV